MLFTPIILIYIYILECRVTRQEINDVIDLFDKKLILFIETVGDVKEVDKKRLRLCKKATKIVGLFLISYQTSFNSSFGLTFNTKLIILLSHLFNFYVSLFVEKNENEYFEYKKYMLSTFKKIADEFFNYKDKESLIHLQVKFSAFIYGLHDLLLSIDRLLKFTAISHRLNRDFAPFHILLVEDSDLYKKEAEAFLGKIETKKKEILRQELRDSLNIQRSILKAKELYSSLVNIQGKKEKSKEKELQSTWV